VPLLDRAGSDPEVSLPRLAVYIASVLAWNRSVSNLISRADEMRLVSRHLVESLEPAGWLEQFGAKQWIDLGSGAGFPALPLAIAGVGKRWLLVESRRPKALFLRRVVRDLGLEDVQIAHARLEDLITRERAGDSDREVGLAGGFPFDAFTSRATLPLKPTLQMAASCLRPGGHAFLWKGSGRVDEMASDRSWAEAWSQGGESASDIGSIVVCNFILKK